MTGFDVDLKSKPCGRTRKASIVRSFMIALGVLLLAVVERLFSL